MHTQTLPPTFVNKTKDTVVLGVVCQMERSTGIIVREEKRKKEKKETKISYLFYNHICIYFLSLISRFYHSFLRVFYCRLDFTICVNNGEIFKSYIAIGGYIDCDWGAVWGEWANCIYKILIMNNLGVQ